jgi:hypothetical protein
VLYAVATCAAGFSPLVYRSTDGGQHWNQPTSLPVVAGANTDGAFVSVDPTNSQNVYLFSSDTVGTQPFCCADPLVFKSTNGGSSWSTSLITLQPTDPNFPEQGPMIFHRLLIDPSNPSRLYAFYTSSSRSDLNGSGMTGNEEQESNAWLLSSDDAGATWTLHLIFTAQPECTDSNTLATDPYGCTDLAHWYNGSAIDSAGNLYATFGERAGGQVPVHIMLITSTDHGGTWSLPLRVDTAGNESTFAADIVAGSPGEVDMLWEQQSGSATGWDEDAAGTWSLVFAQSLDALSASPHFTQSTVDPQIHIGSVCPQACGSPEPGCVSGMPCPYCPADNCTPNGGGGPNNGGDSQAVVRLTVDRNGFAHLVWLRDEPNANGTTHDDADLFTATQTSGTGILNGPAAGVPETPLGPAPLLVGVAAGFAFLVTRRSVGRHGSAALRL